MGFIVAPPPSRELTPLDALPLSTLVALNLRLMHSLVYERPRGDGKGPPLQGSVGLLSHTKPGHICERNPTLDVRVDYSGPGGPAQHPEDYIVGCPMRFHDPVLQQQINLMLWIENSGGLYEVTGIPLGLLPAPYVNFYRLVMGARDRLLEERSDKARR